MILVPKHQLRTFPATISLLLFLSVVASTFAADHLEIKIKLNTTWTSPTHTNENDITVTCILGTNDWYISGQFMKNARVEYWLIGSNVIERKTITSSMYLQQAENFISEKIEKHPPLFRGISYPKKGETWMRTNPWLEPFGYGEERAVWLAFCSGSFLHTPDRQIPLSIGPSRNSLGYSDTTVFLDKHSSNSLPKTVDLFATDDTLVSHYEVLASTNISGRTIPLQFRVIQSGQLIGPGTGQSVGMSTSQSTLLGKVISIKPCEAPAAPGMSPDKSLH